MQTDPNWDDALHHANHPVLRGSGTPSGTASRVDGPPRELHFPIRNGTSQGSRIRSDVLLDALTNIENRIQIEYSGRLSVTGNLQIRIEYPSPSPAPPRVEGVNIWSSETADVGNEISQTVILTHERLQYAVSVGDGDISLGASPGNEAFIITGIRVTEIPPCTLDKWTVEFKLADGTQTCEVDLVQIIIDGEDATPPILKRDGYTFNDWDGEYKNITSDRILTAQWIPIPPDSFTITFNPNGGEFVNPNSDTIRVIPKGNRSGILPRATPLVFSRDGYRFTGWFEDIEDASTQWHDNEDVTSDVTLYARWQQIPDPDNFRVGDADGDGRVTSADVTRLAMHLIGHNVDICLLSADISGRGYVSIPDVTFFARWLVGQNVSCMIAW